MRPMYCRIAHRARKRNHAPSFPADCGFVAKCDLCGVCVSDGQVGWVGWWDSRRRSTWRWWQRQ
ncbi:hypothetical protein BCR44DRAFT_1429878 [Catenaria anguillulae PL171]|uniref:Uncharacterized protein n=1 Tax=Catenaria anguillulae PL171 TaxID=765915 RepID=A0A1Y2HSZ9_9FUNG|nr:hypothetical protein BCR44DRAFT_1429878 [Catenaria anguillulae PL171]